MLRRRTGAFTVASMIGTVVCLLTPVDAAVHLDSAPSLPPLGAYTIESGAPVSIPIRVADPAAQGITYSATNLPAGVEIDAVAGVIAGSTTAVGNYLATITATDRKGASTSGLLALTVTNRHLFVPVSWQDAMNLSVAGSLVTKVAGCDGCPDAHAVSASQSGLQDTYLDIPAVLARAVRAGPADSHRKVSNHVPTHNRVELLRVGFVPDGSPVTAANFSYSVQFWPGNAWDVREQDVSKAGSSYAGDIAATDLFRIAIDGTQVKYYRNGTLIYTGTRAEGVSYRAAVLVYERDATLGAAALAINSPPAVVSIPDRAVDAGALVSIPVTATDPESDVLAYSATNLPSGISIDPMTGVIAGASLSAGTYPVTATVTDGHGGTSSASFTLIVRPPLFGPVTIVAQAQPAPNAAGWNNSDVIVTFTCTNATSCPLPVVLTEDTAGQTIIGTASNSDHQATTSVSVKIDKTPPTIALTSPADGFTGEISSITLSATVVEAVSGLSSIRCNGTPAGTNPSVLCTVPLAPGRNSIVLSARDLAGNNASAGVRITRTGPIGTLRIMPAARTMVAGERRSLVALDEYGQAAAGVAWESSDPTVGDVDATTGILAAQATGHATITASVAGHSASLDLTVVSGGPGGELPIGTTSWAVAPSRPGSYIPMVLPANRVSDDSPDLFVAEHNPADGSNVIRALTADGVQLWAETSPTDWRFGSIVGFADAFGGLVGLTGFGTPGPVGVARFGGPSSALPWRYESSATFMGLPSQSSNGTIFVPEHTVRGADRDAQIVAIDGNDGRALFRVPLPPSGIVTRDDGGPTQRIPIQVSRISIGPDGSAYVQVKIYNGADHFEYKPFPKNFHEIARRRVDSSVQLLTIRPDGSTSWRELEHHVGETDISMYPGDVAMGQTIADGAGGMLASSTHFPIGAPADYHVLRMIDGAETQHVMRNDIDDQGRTYARRLTLTGEDGTVMASSGAALSAIDATTGAEKWRVPVDQGTTLRPLAALPNAGALAVRFDGSSWLLEHIDASGQIVDSQVLGFNGDLEPLHVDDNAFLALDDQGFLAKVVTNSFADRTYAPSPTGQNGPVKPIIVTVAPLNNYTSNGTFTGTDAKRALARAVNTNNVTLDTRVQTHATLFAYLSALGEMPGFQTAIRNARVAMVGFIGHSIEPPGTQTTVGLEFVDRDLIKQRIPINGPQWIGKEQYPGQPQSEIVARAYYLDKVHTQAKVIFVASCFLGAEFESLWEINADRAIVIPENPDVTADLYVSAKYAWPAFSGALSRGKTLGEAISAANKSCSANYDPNDPQRPVCGINAVVWKRVGGHDGMRLVK